MKLSDKQKDVILFMRTGKRIYYSHGLNCSVGFDGGADMKLSLATFEKLQSIGILSVDGSNKSSSLSYYKLTELGKTIEL